MTFPNGGQRDELHPNRKVGREAFPSTHPSLQDDWDGTGEDAIWQTMPDGSVRNRRTGETSRM